MEQKNTNVLTFDDLARFTEEILLPGIEQIIDDKLKPINKNLDGIHVELADIHNELDGIHVEMADIHSELHGIRIDLNNLQERIMHLEKMTKEDLNAYADDVINIKKELKRLELRVNAIEVGTGT
jgi:archaellum component FlaC